MMRKLLACAFAWCVALAVYVPLEAHAQASLAFQVATCGTGAPVNLGGASQITIDQTGKLCVAAVVSASVSGFTPSATNARGTAFTVTSSDSSGTLPTGAVVLVSNPSANLMYCNVNGVAATIADQPISGGGGWFAFTVVSGVTTLHCIAPTGNATANMLGGSGLATGTGGGGGSGGGGSVTQGTTPWVVSGQGTAGSAATGVLTVQGIASMTPLLSSIIQGGNTAVVKQASTVASTDQALVVAVGNANGNGQVTLANSSPVAPASDWINDPCWATTLKLSAPISQTANAKIITGTAAKKTYICSIFTVGADAENLSLVEGTGSTCGTGTAAVIGGATAANGPNFAANGGFAHGAGVGSVAVANSAAADDVCLFQSGSGRVGGVLTYVQK